MNFSIVTPSYNQLDWLRLCVASVRDQLVSNAEGGKLKAETRPVEVASHFTGQENKEPRTKKSPSPLAVEHLIQDAGTPGIEDFAREINADFYRDGELIFSFSASQNSSISRHRIAIYCERDAGMYDAINRGFSKAKGDVVAWLNCDEQYLPHAIEFAADFFTQHPKIDMIFGDAIMLDKNCQPYSYRRVVLPSMDYLRTVSPSLFSCAAFFRHRVIDSGILLDPQWRIIGDAVWFYKLFNAGFKARTVGKPLSGFALTGENLSALAEPSQIEWARWRATRHRPPLLPRSILIAIHRLRKMMQGAYIKRTMDVEVFKPSQFCQRVVHKDSKLGSTWEK